jgi:O-6-methylguanine DNA methyltransferase
MNRKAGNSNQAERAPVSIVEQAARPEVDECDLVCAALPGLLCKDLSAEDARFIDEHVTACSYCRHELEDYRKLESALDVCCECDAPQPPAPAFLPLAKPAWYGEMDSPVGPLFVAATDKGVCEIDFVSAHDQADMVRRLEQRGFHPIENQRAITAIAEQLNEYFSGKRNRFEVPLDFSGVTPFTKAVLAATSDVPFGHLSTYRQIAQSIGQPKATRAVGNALGRNPIPVIVPCHRIVRSDFSLGGYTGGLHIKQTLLKLEGVALA